MTNLQKKIEKLEREGFVYQKDYIVANHILKEVLIRNIANKIEVKEVTKSSIRHYATIEYNF